MNKGILSGIGAYVIWGFLPIYWKLLHEVPAVQIVAHRLVWSLLLLVVLVTALRGWQHLRPAFNRRTLLIFVLATVLLSINWLVYIWAVNQGRVVETSLGYFINPLVNVLLGVVFLRERLTPARWLPVGLATIGVLYLTWNYGSVPWVALVLAFSFGLYGFLKKLSPLRSLYGLTLETAVAFLPAIFYLLYVENQGVGAFGHLSLLPTVLLILSGVVTAVPLLLFASAAQAIPLSTLGLLQYLAPTMQFLIGILLYREPFTPGRLVGFSIIWLALIIFAAGGLYENRRVLQTAR